MICALCDSLIVSLSVPLAKATKLEFYSWKSTIKIKMTKRKEQKMDIRCDAIKVSISKRLRMSIKFQ